MGEGKQRIAITERLAGDFLEGIDLRKTLRAQIRGRDEIFVRDSRFQRGQKDAVAPDGYPVVWIFDLFPKGDSQWEHFLEPTSCMLPQARDPRRLKRRCIERGGNMLAVIGLWERMQMSYMVRSHFDQAEGRPIYDGPVEDILGEKRTLFHDMVPTKWRTIAGRSVGRAAQCI